MIDFSIFSFLWLKWGLNKFLIEIKIAHQWLVHRDQNLNKKMLEKWQIKYMSIDSKWVPEPMV